LLFLVILIEALFSKRQPIITTSIPSSVEWAHHTPPAHHTYYQLTALSIK
jgi:hypothetical protein